MMMRVIPVVLIGLAACSPVPQLETEAPDPNAPRSYLQLAPIDRLIARGSVLTVNEDTTETLQERVQRLKDRADDLREPVLSDEEKDRLETDLQEGLPQDG